MREVDAPECPNRVIKCNNNYDDYFPSRLLLMLMLTYLKLEHCYLFRIACLLQNKRGHNFKGTIYLGLNETDNGMRNCVLCY